MWSLFPMRVTLGWPPVRHVADILRRGAWYPIVEEADGHVVVEVDRQRVRLPAATCDSDGGPRPLSIVARTGGCSGHLGRAGEVTSSPPTRWSLCHYRQDFADNRQLKCVRCGASSPVDWRRDVLEVIRCPSSWSVDRSCRLMYLVCITITY